MKHTTDTTASRERGGLLFLTAALAALVVVAAAQPVAGFYAMPLLKQLLPLMALNFVLLGLTAQYQANLIRTFGAARLAKIEVISRVLSFSLTIVLLVMMHLGPYAIVIGTLTFAVLKLLGLVTVAERHWHPQLGCDKTIAKQAIAYGAYQAGSQLINQFRTQLDQLIIGKALGAEALGIYSLAKELISYPLRILQPLVSRLVLPRLAKVQGDAKQLQNIFISGLQRTALLSGLVYALLTLFSLWAVEILYGAQYIAVAALVPLLALFGVLRPLGLNAGMLAQALGRTDNEFKWNLLCALIALPLMLLVAIFYPQVEAFALVLSAQQLLLTVLAYPYFVRPLSPVGLLRYVRAWGGVALIMLGLIWLASVMHLPSITTLYTHVIEWVISCTGWRG